MSYEMKQFDKYEENVKNAQALCTVGKSIQSSIDWLMECNERSKNEIAELKGDAEANGTDNAWSIKYAENDIDERERQLVIWRIAQKAIDKELAF